MESDPALHWFDQFGVDETLIRKALAAATINGADDADLFFEHSVSTAIGLSDRIVNRAHTNIDLGVGVRVVVGDQVGYAYTEDLDIQAILRAAGIAAAIARTGKGVGEPVSLHGAKQHNFYPVARHWSDVDLSERVPLVRDWEARAFAADSRITKVQVGLADTDRHVLICRADGRLSAD
jgi:TldD protein